MNIRSLFAVSLLVACGPAFAGGVVIPVSTGNASNTYMPAYSAPMASDGNTYTLWNSGGGAPQSIEIDLGSDRTFSRLRMLPAQSPAGFTRHGIYGSPSNRSGWVYLGEVAGYSSDGLWIQFDNRSDIQVRYLSIRTTQSPSWVAWREFQVYDGGAIDQRCTSYPMFWGSVISSTINSPGSCAGYSDHILWSHRDIRNQPNGVILEVCSPYNMPSGWSSIGSYRDIARCYGFANTANGRPIDNVFLIRNDNP